MEFRIAIMQATGLPCERINADVLATVWQLNISGANIKNISAADFQGLNHLETLALSYCQIENILPGTFSNLPILKNLFLNNNNIRKLEAGAFDGLTSLTALQLQDNPLVSLDPQAFRELKSLNYISLEDTLLREILPGTFSNDCHLVEIGLSRNSYLTTIPDFAFANCLSSISVTVTGAPLGNTRKAAFHGVREVKGLPARFDVDNFSDDWGQP